MEGVSTRFFLNECDMHKLQNCTLCIVPPQLDFPRSLTVKEAKLKNSKKQQIFLAFNEDVDLRDLVGKSLLIEKDFAEKNFEALNDSIQNDLIGKLLIDENLGEIGKVIDVGGDAQKHLIVERDSKFVYVPYVDEIIVDVKDGNINAKLPSGLLDINEA